MYWSKEGVNYWENPDCPVEYLESSLVQLINDVEGAELPENYFKGTDRHRLVEEIKFYEYVSDK